MHHLRKRFSAFHLLVDSMLFRVWMGSLQSHILRLGATSLPNKIYLSVPFDGKDHVLNLKMPNSDIKDLCELHV